MESDVSKLQRDRQGHISTGVVYLFILCCHGALGHPELWAQGRNRNQAAIEVTELAGQTQEGEASRVPPIDLSERRRTLLRQAQPPVEVNRTDPRQEQLLQAQLTVNGLKSRLGELRKRQRALQREFQPAARADRLDLAKEERFQAELEVTQSEMAAVEAWLKAKEIEVDVLQQTQELYEQYESMVGSEEQVKPIKQVADARHLVAMLEGVRNGLLKLMDAWGSARHSSTQHLEMLNRAIEDSKKRNVNEEVLQLFTDLANRARQGIAILQQQTDRATQRFEYLLSREEPLANERLKVAEERLRATEPERFQPAAPPPTTVPPLGAPVDELRRDWERKEAEAGLLAKEESVLKKQEQMATTLFASTRKDKRRYEWHLEFARTELARLKREQAPGDAIPAAEARIDSLQGTVDSTQESLSKLNGWVQATGLRARAKELHAESARRDAADVKARLDNEMRRDRNRRIISIVMAILIVAITIGLITLVRRLRTKKFLSLPDTEKQRQHYAPYLLIRRTAVPVIVFVGTLLVLMQFETFQRIGVTILASAGLISLVVGFAARDVLANTMAGVMLCFSRSIRVGDTVKIGDEYGTIEDIGLLHTRFLAWDNRRVVIPNEVLSKKEVVNYTLGEQKIRTKVPIHLDYAADVKKARSILIDVVKQSRNWNGQEDPDIWFMELGQQTITIWVAAWADDPGKAWGLSCDILDNALERFKQEGIALPRRHYQHEDPKTVFESGTRAASETQERDKDSGASTLAQIDAPIFPRKGTRT